MKTGILYFTTCFHLFGILRHVDPFVRMLHIRNNHLDKRLNLDPNDNYELFAGLIKYAREKHLPKIKVKYNKKKHSFSKWMTNEILQSINQKNRSVQ